MNGFNIRQCTRKSIPKKNRTIKLCQTTPLHDMKNHQKETPGGGGGGGGGSFWMFWWVRRGVRCDFNMKICWGQDNPGLLFIAAPRHKPRPVLQQVVVASVILGAGSFDLKMAVESMKKANRLVMKGDLSCLYFRIQPSSTTSMLCGLRLMGRDSSSRKIFSECKHWNLFMSIRLFSR